MTSKYSVTETLHTLFVGFKVISIAISKLNEYHVDDLDFHNRLSIFFSGLMYATICIQCFCVVDTEVISYFENAFIYRSIRPVI